MATRLALLFVALLTLASPAPAVTIDWVTVGDPGNACDVQSHDFQDGTTEGWSGGSSPTNVATGGPGGAGDRYLQITAVSGNLGASVFAPWTGSYTAAGVSALSFDLNNFGPDPVALRISVFGVATWTSTLATVLAPGSGWVTVVFGLGEADLTRTQGRFVLARTLGNVNTLLIRHDSDPISPQGESNPVTATLGIDNVTAVPEPGTGLLVAAGVATLGIRHRRSA